MNIEVHTRVINKRIIIIKKKIILFLHFALEFARCPYRILQINYVDVDVDVIWNMIIGKPRKGSDAENT